MMPWIILSSISLILGVNSVFLLLISLQLGAAVGEIISLILQAYLFIVVWSYRFSDIF